jgi:hypothetical protein
MTIEGRCLRAELMATDKRKNTLHIFYAVDLNVNADTIQPQHDACFEGGA